MTCFAFTPPRDEQSWDNQRQLGTKKKGKDYQCQPRSRSDYGSLHPALQKAPETAMTKPTASIVIGKPLKILVLITFQGSTLADSDFLSPVFPLNFNRAAPATDALRPKIHIGGQPRSFWLGMCRTPSQTPAAAQVSILHQWKAVGIMCFCSYTHTHLPVYICIYLSSVYIIWPAIIYRHRKAWIYIDNTCSDSTD